MFTISAPRITIRFVALLTAVSLVLSAFPAAFFVANAEGELPPAEEIITTTDTTVQTVTNPDKEVEEEILENQQDFSVSERKSKEKPMVCHANNSNEQANNPFSYVKLDAGQGHSDHEEDIIPVTDGFPNGQNLTTTYPQFGGVTGQQILDNGCEVPESEPEEDSATIVAAKIICEDEADLPNWGAGGFGPITSTTAVDWVDAHDGCYIAKDWQFQWGDQNAADFGDTTLGYAPDYTTFTGSAIIPLEDVSEIHLREVLQTGYIPFTHEATPDNSNNVSAEFYCADDVLNYDNWDFIRNPQAGQTYHCVAWNVPVSDVEEPVCEIGENLINNGGFEEETVTSNGGQWQIFATVAGWVIGLSDGLEIWNTFNGNGNDFAAEGEQNAELDGNDATSITQTVATTPGATYELAYAYAPRAGTALADSKMEALVNGAVVATDNTDGSTFSSNQWESKTYSFVATGTTTKVAFRDAGVANANGGYGPLLDGVSLCKVKEAPRCELSIVSDTNTIVDESNTLAVATYTHGAWTAAIPGATWIWSSATVTDPGVDTTRTFVETFTITNPTNAQLVVAADNGYQVYLNNVLVVDNLTVENNYSDAEKDVIPLTLASGANELKVVVKNFARPGWSYKQNPAGVLFKLTAVGTENCERTTEVEKAGPVTMCKLDTNKRPLAGWTMTLLGNKVEDVVVPTNVSAGINTVNTLTAGKSYVAKASGTWNNQGGANPADAEYSTTDGWTTWVDGYLPYTTYSTDILELQINNTFDPASNWGVYNSAHTYAQAFTPTATGTVNFRIFDGTGSVQNPGWFGDNSGTLNVTVYEGFAGITGKDGCVTFENVPFGTYTTGEVMQDGWEYVSGADEVVVSSKNNEFSLINKYAPKYTDEINKIVVNSNTASGENQPGWMFGRDLSSATPFSFSAGNQKIGVGSLTVPPIVNTNNSDKFIGEYFFLNKLDLLKSFSADYKLNASTSPVAFNQIYFNVYANFGTSSPTKFYDCRYNIVATTASSGAYTTLVFDPTLAYPVTTRTGGSASPFTCPAIPADMNTLSSGSVIRMIALNIGDLSNGDTGVGGYFDNVVVKTQDDSLLQKKTTIFDFEPAPIVEPKTFTLEGYKYECYLDDEYYCDDEDGIADWLITATNGDDIATTTTDENGYYSFELPLVGNWTISEEMPAGWQQVEVIQNGDYRKSDVCYFNFDEDEELEGWLSRAAEFIWPPEYTCDFGNYYDRDGDDDYTETISGFKWNDLDGNGVRNGEEPTLSNWVIALYNGETLVATTSTNGAGLYSFEVEEGEWTVAEVQQSGWTQTGTIRNSTSLASTTKNCTFSIEENDDSEYSDLSRNSESINSCDFGNRQNQVIEEPEQPTRNGSRSSGTRTNRPQGQVLGATTQCGLWLEDYMQKATVNDSYQVLKLQVFLNLEGIVTPLTGTFDSATEASVKQFQSKYYTEVIKPWFDRGIVPHSRPTGFVYKTTRWKINDIMCPGIEPYPSFEGENLTTNVLLNR